MKAQLVLLCLGLTFAASVASALRHSQWKAYKHQFGKSYTGDEDLVRKAILTEAKQKVLEHNAKRAEERGFTMAINHMSDWTTEEHEKLNGFRVPEQRLMNSLQAEKFLADILNDDTPIPDSVDWRKVPGRVTEVKDQGLCGSCWAFSTTGVLEGQQAVQGSSNKSLVSLSEQDLVDCSTSNMGCAGGLPFNALADIHKMGGIESEENYPYLSTDQQCKFVKNLVTMTDKGGAVLPKGDVQALKKMVARYGPVSVGMDAEDDLIQYKSGIFHSNLCDSKSLDHGVLAVGYGTDPKYGDYWIIKNSWGAGWGEEGYFRISSKDNHCGIATYASVPIF